MKNLQPFTTCETPPQCRRTNKKTALLTLTCLFIGSTSYGAGFSNFTQGAGPVGVGNATIGHAEGISSIYYNPVHQLEFEGLNLEGGFSLLSPEKTLDSSVTGETYESNSKIYSPVHFAATYRTTDTISLGFTVNNSFGLGSDFDNDTVFKYITTESELVTWDINPSLGFKFSDQFAIATGFRVIYTEASLQQMVPLQSVGLPDGKQSFEADGTGYGWNIGATYSPTERWSIGASYRSPVDVELDGDVSFSLPVSSPLLTSLFPDTGAESELNLPGQLFLGVAYKPSPKWVFEVATRLEQYSCYEKLSVTSEAPIAGQTSRTIEKNWDDVWGYMAGGSYQTDAGYRFSAGYIFEENPVPDETFEPGVSGLNKHTLTVGLGKQIKNITGKISYAHDFYEDREISNSGTASLVNGTQSQTNQMLIVSLAWQL
ncbi:OmpP1/FadL family transporter [Desulforhopalus sp. 52FAK]